MRDTTPYSRLDRLTHRLAFRNKVLREVLSDLETRLLREHWADFNVSQPVFITSLPRAGTTVLLEALHRLPTLASHTYRDMPFVMTPVLWDRLSARIRSQATLRERAHGDGLEVSEDSPEALEEILWKQGFPGKYAATQIELWSTNDDNWRDFAADFREHMRKITYLRRPDASKQGRYLSKNNANIARCDLLRAMFPDSFIVVPLRDPVQHAISMWRQHRNFSEKHAAEPFVLEYMEDVGHFEFGALHKPFAFAELKTLTKEPGPESVEYWLAYWISAFDYLAARSGVDFICFEALCEVRHEGLRKLVNHLRIEVNDEDVEQAAGVFRPAPAARSVEHDLPRALVDRSLATYERLKSRCLISSR